MNGVLITAGGNGIGWAMGQAFAAAGFRVWVTDVEAASLDACPVEWQKSLVDASDETQVADLFAEIHKTWGVPVRRGNAPWPGMEGKVFYVWFDAPIEYIASAREWVDAGKGDDWQRWWRTDKGAEDVRYVQFMGKDNVPFHTLSFPATILGSREPWKLVDYIK